MKRMKLQSMALGELMTNTYFLKNEESGELVLIDPAASAGRIRQKIDEMGACPCAILLTHGHYDHIGAVPELKSFYPELPVYACGKEQDLLANPEANLSSYFGNPCTVEPDHLLSDLSVITLAGFSFQMLHTPGHTPGSCCYYLEEEKVLFSGDTLFAGSCGRTDFPGGSAGQMRQSLKRLLGSLPDDTEVFPGHNSVTTIGEEKRDNPFV